VSGFHEYSNQDVGYSFAVPQGFSHEQDDRDGMFFGYADTSVFGHVAVQAYDAIGVDIPCAPSLTGASKTAPLTDTGADASWGRVDFWDTDNVLYKLRIAAEDPTKPIPVPLCHPPFPPSVQDRLSPPCGGKVPQSEAEEDGMCGQWRRDYELKHGLYSAYALCSEHNGKTVVICLSQATDDPKMAEEIFSTFRWTE
jgi:hypothetical protein